MMGNNLKYSILVFTATGAVRTCTVSSILWKYDQRLYRVVGIVGRWLGGWNITDLPLKNVKYPSATPPNHITAVQDFMSYIIIQTTSAPHGRTFCTTMRTPRASERTASARRNNRSAACLRSPGTTRNNCACARRRRPVCLIER